MVEVHDGFRVFNGESAVREVVGFFAFDAPLLAGEKYRLPEVVSAVSFDFAARVHPEVIFDTTAREFRIFGLFTAELLQNFCRRLRADDIGFEGAVVTLE